VRVFARTTAYFSRTTPDGLQTIDGHFTSHRQVVSSGHEFDFSQLLSDFLNSIENFTKRGSGFSLEIVCNFTLVITQYRPLAGSSYIPTPPTIAKKLAVVNVQNNDQRCFEWSILSCLYPPQINAERVSNYSKYQGTLNFDGIDFAVKVKDIPKFETLNPQISVNVISPDPENKGYSIDYLSP